MKFKNLKQEDADFIKETHSNKSLPWDERVRILTQKYDISNRTLTNWVKKLNLSQSRTEEPIQLKDAKKKKYNKKSKRFIITWAQNNTPVFDPFFNNIEAYANHIKAEIHVIAGRYKNPTSVFTDSDQDSWASRLTPYLDASRHDVHKHMSIMSDVKIQPTAVNALSGLHGMSKQNSCVFGHPKMQMESLPILNGMKHKMMMTTGSCTKANYTDSKAGKKGEFHHSYGFVVIEIKDNKTFFVRQVTADEKTGSFTDLYYNVASQQVTRIDSLKAMILGDIHIGEHDPEVIKATKKLLKKLEPENLVFHDICDGRSVNPHEMNNPFLSYQRDKADENDLDVEIDQMMVFLKDFEKYNSIIVRSNHDDFVDRYLKTQDWKKDIKNSLAYMKYAQLLLENKAPDGVIPYLIKQKFPHFKTLGLNDSFRVGSWELSQHGHIGSNGSRGGMNQFVKLNTKMVTAHTHSPARKDGVMVAGTSTFLRVGYNNGASGWMNAHVLIHQDDKAQHIFFFEGEFTTFE